MHPSPRTWVWVGLLWTPRVRLVLDRYGDRLADVSIFGWAVDKDGTLAQTFDPAQLDPYRAKWPHIRWWGCLRNMDAPSGATARQVFDALRFGPAARNRLASDVSAMLADHPWLHGVDIDLEGGGDHHQSESEEVIRRIANAARARGKRVSVALPALTATGSVGGENWVRYRQIGRLVDHASIMSYDFAWNGSAPGPISPGSWWRDVASWATSQIPAHKLSLGLPAYARAWAIHDYPTGRYRGTSGTYYSARNWLDGTWPDGPWTHSPDEVDQPRMAWLAFRDPVDHVPHALLGVWDWVPPHGRHASQGYTFDRFAQRGYAVRYGKPAGNPLWSLANNTPSNARAVYSLAPRPLRDITGARVAPRHGFTLTIELLQREPESATILDDDCRTHGQLASTIYSRSGTWAHWQQGGQAERPYSQYRTGPSGGTLRLNRNFGAKALHLQARAQLAAPGWWGVQLGQIRAEVNQAGQLRITHGGAPIATTAVTAPGTSIDPGHGRAIVGIRVRNGKVRAYYSRTATSAPLVLQATVPVAAAHGFPAIWASTRTWVDHIRLGDGWWYQPREAIAVTLGGRTHTLGRIPRTGVTWDAANRFRPVSDVEERETRTRPISPDWIFEHVKAAPLAINKTTTIVTQPLDIDCWMGRLFACDSQGARILYYADVEYLAHWADIAHHDYGAQGAAIWTLGQEDIRIWERIAGGGEPSAA